MTNHFFFFFFFPAAGSRHSHDLQDGPALFFFGDTYSDVGNNNYINATTTLQANFWPYGQTFFNYPTGCYSDGRLIPDFIAEFAKRPLLLPCKHPGNYQHAGGANFSSSGASALAQTFQGLAINLHTQLNYFKEVERQLGGGIEAKKALLSRAIFVISIGAANYASPFWTNKTGRLHSTVLQEGKHACYGSGPYGRFLSCGEKRGLEYELCGNPSEHVFFDLVHPSETAYEQFSKLMWSGPPSVVWPNNLKALLKSSVDECMVPPSGVSVEL